MTRRTTRPHDGRARERAALVGLSPGSAHREDTEASLDELVGLADAAGADVVYRMIQERARPDPATFLGSGKIQTLAAACEETDASLVIFDNELSPAQLRNLEKVIDRRVIDRTQLILDIFAKRARTREGKLQVELAQLRYLLPRLAGVGASLSRLGGGIGTRGPGETKLETDRRRIRTRIATLAKTLDEVRERRERLRERRQERAQPAVALVGYTNAGKTTLFNRLTRERAVATDALFVTLDPLVRQVRLPSGGRIMLSDTVGFIDRLPHTLVAAFRATLEEVIEADLLVHVVDGSSEEMPRHIEAVRSVLEEVGAVGVPTVLAVNKADRLDRDARERLARAMPGAFVLSAATGLGVDALLEDLTVRLRLDTRRMRLVFDNDDEDDRARLAIVRRHGIVLGQTNEDGRVALDVDLPRRVLDWLTPAAADR